MSASIFYSLYRNLCLITHFLNRMKLKQLLMIFNKITFLGKAHNHVNNHADKIML